jgi:hypothetical protein
LRSWQESDLARQTKICQPTNTAQLSALNPLVVGKRKTKERK